MIGGRQYTQSFNVPNCSAPLDPDGDGFTTLRCPYCQTSVIILEVLRLSKPGVHSAMLFINTFNPSYQVDLDERLKSISEKVISANQIEAIRLLRETSMIGLSGIFSADVCRVLNPPV